MKKGKRILFKKNKILTKILQRCTKAVKCKYIAYKYKTSGNNKIKLEKKNAPATDKFTKYMMFKQRRYDY